MRSTLYAVLLLLAAACITPALAGAVTIHRHILVHKASPVGDHKVVPIDEVVLHLPPPDSDDDGCANSSDTYQGPGCKPPPPPPPPAPTTVAAPTVAAPAAPAPAPVGGGCPSYMSGEASSPTDVNPSSGASGCWQVIPSTADAMGAACTDVNSTACLSAICAAQGNSAWEASGATPC